MPTTPTSPTSPASPSAPASPVTLLNPAKLTIAQCRAKRALALPLMMHKRLLRSWAEGLDAVWSSSDPASVIAAMGTQAGELFTRSAQVREFLESQLPGSSAIPQAAKIKPVTIHPDGTVTLAAAK
jgi:hypothetical protein